MDDNENQCYSEMKPADVQRLFWEWLNDQEWDGGSNQYCGVISGLHIYTRTSMLASFRAGYNASNSDPAKLEQVNFLMQNAAALYGGAQLMLDKADARVSGLDAWERQLIAEDRRLDKHRSADKKGKK